MAILRRRIRSEPPPVPAFSEVLKSPARKRWRSHVLFLSVALSLSAVLFLAARPSPQPVPADPTVTRTTSGTVRALDLARTSPRPDDPAAAAALSEMVADLRRAAGPYVEQLTGSWYRYAGAYRVPEAPPAPEHHAAAPPTPEPEPIVWDGGDAAGGYLSDLAAACGNGTGATDPRGCLGRMHGLVRDPLCTVRMDSRYKCDGTGHADGRPGAIGSVLGRGFFADGTVNVVVIGAGPVGLFLANALTEAQIRRSVDGSAPPPPRIRIVVFENRVHAEGRKKPYTRTFMTAVSPSVSTGVIDPRIHDVTAALFGEGPVSLPINFWETLLLLSNRDRGVRFIYGEFADYARFLRAVPNLLVVDASGHRLQGIDRGTDGKNPGGTRISGWKGRRSYKREKTADQWQFPRAWLFDPESNIVATRETRLGTILYPVLPNGTAYYIHRFDVMNLPRHKKLAAELEHLAHRADNKFYNETGVDPPFQGGRIVYFDEIDALAPPLGDVLNDPAEQFLGFALRAVSIKPTREQGEYLEEIIRGHGRPGAPDLPLSAISPIRFRKGTVLGTNGAGRALRAAVRYSAAVPLRNCQLGPWVSAYRTRPFIYADVVVPGGYDLAGRTVPMVRVGDSLFSGDTDISSGLAMHMNLVKDFWCLLLKDLCPV